jgi:hypothetical protein
MNSALRRANMPNLRPFPSTEGDQKTAVHPRGWQTVPKAGGHRFDPLTIGFWVGGFVMGTGGCILGACMAYHDPVGVTISVLWWGIYWGCFGAAVGAGVGEFCLARKSTSKQKAFVQAEAVDDRSMNEALATG